jgi:hypothetical protein
MRGEAVFGKQPAKHRTVKENFSKSTILPYGLYRGRKVAQGGKFMPDANLELAAVIGALTSRSSGGCKPPFLNNEDEDSRSSRRRPKYELVSSDRRQPSLGLSRP